MSLRAATPELVDQQVRAVLRQRADARALALRAEPRWSTGPLDVDGRRVVVEPCGSPLAVRATLARWSDDRSANEGREIEPGDPTGPNDVLVVLCDLSDADLGADVLARLTPARVLGLEPWKAVQSLFAVLRLDAAFRKDDSWMAEALLTHVPADLARSLTARAVLSVDVALDALARQLLGAPTLSVDGILTAAAGSNPFAALATADPTTRTRLLDALAHRHGPLGQLVASVIRHDRGGELLSLGLAARAVYGHGEHDGGRPAGRLEARIDGGAIAPATGAALAGRCEEAVAELARSDRDRANEVLADANELAADLGADTPEDSDWLAAGFDRRIELAAGLLDTALSLVTNPIDTGPGPGSTAVDSEARSLLDDLGRALERVSSHQSATSPGGRARHDHLTMAARLTTWLATPEAPFGPGHAAPGGDGSNGPSSFEEAAARYVDTGAWVDRARRRLWRGDADLDVAATYRRVIDAVVVRRRSENQAFAERLAAWTTTPGSATNRAQHGLVCVEDVAAEVVGPLGRVLPTVFVVLDGCGLASFVELAPQLGEVGYREVARTSPADAPPRRLAGVSVLPTVTEVSRASLLAGHLDRGNQGHERRAFAASTDLRVDGRPGALFHQNSVTGPAGTALAVEVSTALEASGPGVVGVVLNTIDDHLKRGTFPDALRIGDIHSLIDLLDAARTHGRAVVISADHGHVLAQPDDGGTGTFAGGGSGGERWRDADRAPGDTEVLLQGERVRLGGNAGVLAPWDDDFRYGAKAGGYHGGATPEEVLVPVAVFVPAGIDPPPGWDHLTQVQPLWWDLRLPAPTGPAPTADGESEAPSGRGRRRPRVDENQPPMFDIPAETPTAAPGPTGGTSVPQGEPGWLSALLASDVWKAQKSSAARAALPEERVRAVLSVVHRRGGVASFAAVAADSGIPQTRLAGFLAHLALALNVDGYAVLDVNGQAQEITLSTSILAQQFQIQVDAP